MQLFCKLLAAFWNWLQLVQIYATKIQRFNFYQIVQSTFECTWARFECTWARPSFSSIDLVNDGAGEGKKEEDLSDRIDHLNARWIPRSKKAAKNWSDADS